MALKLTLKREIILPEEYFSREDFDSFQEEGIDFDDLIDFLEEDMLSFFNFTNGLKGFVQSYEWSEQEDEFKSSFLDNFADEKEIH